MLIQIKKKKKSTVLHKLHPDITVSSSIQTL